VRCVLVCRVVVLGRAAAARAGGSDGMPSGDPTGNGMRTKRECGGLTDSPEPLHRWATRGATTPEALAPDGTDYDYSLP
jgi:hypothetical protein